MALRISLKLLAGIEAGPPGDMLMEEFRKLIRGVFSAPIDLPGTNFRRALQASSLSLSLSHRQYSSIKFPS